MAAMLKAITSRLVREHGMFSSMKSFSSRIITESKPQRIAKILASSDLGLSRRDAERVIEDGRVWVNGEKISSPALLASESDKLQVDGKIVTFHGNKNTLMFVAHKLPGELVTRRDPAGRATIIDRLKLTRSLRKLVDQLVFVGRLDVNSEGLLLMTNSGELARKLEMGAGLVERKYRVRVHGIVAPWKLTMMRKGLTVEGVRYKPMDVNLEHDRKSTRGREKKGDKKEGTNTWLTFTCTEGKNRQIRKICKHLNLDVSRLIRVGYGPYTLEGCDRGGFLKVDAKMAKKYLHDLENPEEEEFEEEEMIGVMGVSEEVKAKRRKPMTRNEAARFQK